MTTHLVFTYLNQMNVQGASDMYLTVGFPPAMRVENRMEELRPEPLTTDEIEEIVTAIFTTRQRRDFESKMEINSSLDLGVYGRFRINAMRQRQRPALVIRRIVSRIPSFEELNLPPIMEKLAMHKRGLVLLTGMTGSGKSTTLASLIDYRNQQDYGHIVTIEDPIEYFHDHKKCIVSQREVGVDTESYATALKNVLRQRPDVILVGEIRDREVMEQALLVAETGHLCLATLHTTNTYQAIERIVNFFPEEYAHQIRLNLASNLKAIVSQRLVPGIDGNMRLVPEVMLNEGLIRELILEGRGSKIREVMEQNVNHGMCSFDQSLLDLYVKGQISEQVAINQADMPGDLKIKIKQANIGQEGAGLRSVDTQSLAISEPEDPGPTHRRRHS